MRKGPISSATVSNLLALTRTSLWHTPAECLPFDALPIDWDEIGVLSVQQTVAPLALNTALNMPERYLPPKELILKAYSLIERNRRTHVLLDRSVAEACHKLSEIGIRPVLLKGQAYALAYPDKTLRQCGDIDLYIGEKDYRNAYMATKVFGWKGDERFDMSAKHYGCTLNGVRIELHRVAGILPSTRCNQRFQEWSRRQMQSGRSVVIEGKEIAVPTPIFDMVFVFMHLYHHFINGGIGLRQVCDWTILLHTHHKDVEVAELEKLLKDFGLLRGWRLFTPIAVRHLGLPENECPLYSRKHNKEADRILSFILKEGNFGRAARRKSRRPKKYLIRKIHSLLSLSRTLLPKLAIDPQLILTEYIKYVKNGMTRILKDIRKK